MQKPIERTPVIVELRPARLPTLRIATIGDCLCFACGVLVGQIDQYARGNIGLRTLCSVCIANYHHAQSRS